MLRRKMKTKKILFKISGILKIVAGSCIILLFLLLLALCSPLKTIMLEAGDSLETLINELVATSSEYEYLQSVSHEEMAMFLIDILRVFSIIMIICGGVAIALGIFNLIFAKKYNEMLRGRKAIKIVFVILSFVLYFGIITNVLTTIAMFLKDDKEDIIEVE